MDSLLAHFVAPTCYDLRVSALFIQMRQRLDDMDHDLHIERLRRAAQSLEGLSCGDAFGEGFFLPTGLAESMIEKRAVGFLVPKDFGSEELCENSF